MQNPRTAMRKKGCSMVELMAIQVQRPHWFVSHAWIEPWIGKLSRLLETVLLHFVCQQQVTFPLIIHIPLEALVEFLDLFISDPQ